MIITGVLKDFLASVVAEHLPSSSSELSFGNIQRGGETFSINLAGKLKLPISSEKIAEDLVNEALSSGLPITHQRVEKGRLGGGNTAEVVAQVTLHAPFAFKLDNATKKLGEEGLTMRKIKGDKSLPQKFRDAWPVIYAVRHEEPPYAYLMEFFPREDGWLSLEERLYPTGKGELPTLSSASRWTNTVLDILFSGYEASVNKRLRPNLIEDYVGRIRERLEKTAQEDKRFDSRTTIVNGQKLRPWKDYLNQINQCEAFLNQIAPPFTTVTHGDPNPGNIMLRVNTPQVELKLIDPKEWMTGDYLFDVTKITHYLQATGPIERPAEPWRGIDFGSPGGGKKPTADLRLKGNMADLNYTFDTPRWTASLVEACRERVAKFAAGHHDSHWLARYELGMAANLLGLPLGRLDKGRELAALILFGEGLKWLDTFCTRLGSVRGKSVLMAKANDIEPKRLRKVREWVRANVPGVHQNQDRRGFQLHQWDPVRPNNANKPAELSLEHEVRLMTDDEHIARKVLEELTRCEGQPTEACFLEKDSPVAGLIVRREKRGPGAQSVDRYYDIPVGGGISAIIPRMITVRERLKGSEFMTWSAANNGMRPLNLELPFIALGDGGMTARLEFNWIDDLRISLDEALSTKVTKYKQRRNPFFIAMQVEDLLLAGLVPVLEHTTYRQKFGLWQTFIGRKADKQIFALNLDLIIAQDLETKNIGTYWDVDISSVLRMDLIELNRVLRFAEAVKTRYGLQPNPGSKAWRDAEVTGLLTRLIGIDAKH